MVPKKNGDARLCGNYRPTLNPQLHDNGYPLHVIEDLMSELNGFVVFTALDLSGAYLQLALEDESIPLTI